MRISLNKDSESSDENPKLVKNPKKKKLISEDEVDESIFKSFI